MQGRVFIIGLGLIGGSLALCIKKAHPHSHIVGYDVNGEQSRLAKMLGVIDEKVENIPEGAKDADLIIIAIPVTEVLRTIDLLKDVPLKPNCIITDTGSTKVKIVKKAEIFKEKGITFIGGHPMAGSHKSGVIAAKELLFENAFYLFTPESHVDELAINRLKTWLKGTKAKFLVIAPEEHDYLTGVISHFPHVIAASLVHQAEKTSRKQSLVTRLAAGGFRDITRIASSSPEMWRDISLHNKEVLIDLLAQWQHEMEQVKQMLENEDGEKLYEYFSVAKQYRDELPMKEKGAIPSFYDLYVEIPDYPGVISEITGYLAEENISITNIRIRETRESVYGALRLSFQTEKDRERAAKCISRKTNYEISYGL